MFFQFLERHLNNIAVCSDVALLLNNITATISPNFYLRSYLTSNQPVFINTEKSLLKHFVDL